MKISKLFHWLYAILMLLPIAVFLPTGLYYAFNHEAQAQEKIKVEPIYYQSNEVNSDVDIISGNIYKWVDDLEIYTTNTAYTFMRLEYNSLYPTATYIWHSTDNKIYLTNLNNIYVNTEGIEFYFVPTSYSPSTTYPNFYTAITETDFQVVKGYEDITYTMSITDSMVYAWDETWHNTLFSWANDSFLTVPFRYLTDLFSIPSTSTIIYAFSYWLTISIVWLCFDVIIYVPQIAHRWLDKASLE